MHMQNAATKDNLEVCTDTVSIFQKAFIALLLGTSI
jgi:hypothetical protein